MNLTINKIWQASDGTAISGFDRYASIDVNILQDGTQFQTATLAAADGWTTTINDLPDDNGAGGNPYVYTVEEDTDTHPVGFNVSVGDLTGTAPDYSIDITNTGQTISLTIDKEWHNPNGTAIPGFDEIDHVEVVVLQNNTQYTTLTLEAVTGWSTTDNTLPLIDQDGNDYSYTASESQVPSGWSAAIGDPVGSGGVYTITATNTREIVTSDLTINAVWQESDSTPISGFDEIASFDVVVLQNGAEYATETLSATNWSVTIPDVPETDIDLNEYTYTINSVNIDGFTTTVGAFVNGVATITNTRNEASTMDLIINKVWHDTDGTVIPDFSEIDSVAVTVLQNGQPYETTAVTADDGWSVTIANAPADDGADAPYTYTVRELDMIGWEAAITQFTGDETSQTATITNTRFTAFDGGIACDFDSVVAESQAGRELLFCIFSQDGTRLLAIAGQQDLTLNVTVNTTDVQTKDSQTGWGATFPGAKNWDVSVTGLTVQGDESLQIILRAMQTGEFLCAKIVREYYNSEANEYAYDAVYEGLVGVTGWSDAAPVDGQRNYTANFGGIGRLWIADTATPEELALAVKTPDNRDNTNFG